MEIKAGETFMYEPFIQTTV